MLCRAKRVALRHVNNGIKRCPNRHFRLQTSSRSIATTSSSDAVLDESGTSIGDDAIPSQEKRKVISEQLAPLVLMSQTWIPSGGIAAGDEMKDDPTSLLVRAGFIRQAHSGVFQYLPLAFRLQQHLETVIRHYLRKLAHTSEISLSSLSTEELWRKSGRIEGKPLKDTQHHFLTVSDRKESGFILSPTHEEEITSLVMSTTKSYKEFPLRLYQISRKYRDELRPRHGLLRTKEFTMKDMYTFDINEAAALETYDKVREIYRNLFQYLGLPVIEAKASSGDMGGSHSHEYHVLSPLGEDTIHICGSCGYAENEEVANAVSEHTPLEEITGGMVCPQCNSGSLSKHSAIELGHTFHLGTRYSEPLDAAVNVPYSHTDPNNGSNATTGTDRVHLQMGCHGIGVSRLIGAAASIFSDSKGLRWPLTFSTYHAVVVFDGTETPDGLKSKFVKVKCRQVEYTGMLWAIRHMIDDRDKPLSWKLKDADLMGAPIVVVVGRKFKETGEYEIQCRWDPSLSVNTKDLTAGLVGIMNTLDPDAQNTKEGKPRWHVPSANVRAIKARVRDEIEKQKQSALKENTTKSIESAMLIRKVMIEPSADKVRFDDAFSQDKIRRYKTLPLSGEPLVSAPESASTKPLIPGPESPSLKSKKQKKKKAEKPGVAEKESLLPNAHLMERVQLLERLMTLQGEAEALQRKDGK